MLSLSKPALLPVLIILIFGLPAVPAAAASAEAPRTSRAVSVKTEVVIRNGDVSLRGLVVAPPRARNLPGVVLVHGAGPHTRDDLMREAEEFARHGVVALVHDKRAKGYSLGERSFADLAGDELAAVRVLRARPEIDPGRVGLWGLSEGGWVAPLAASRSADVTFLITAGAGGHSPERVQVWSNAEYLAHAGVSGRPLDHLAEGITPLLVAGGMFGAAGYDPVPALERVRQPVLAVWGAYERSVPAAESALIFRQTLHRTGNDQLTVRFFPNAAHDLRQTNDGFTTTNRFADGYFALMTSWIHRETTPAKTAPPTPHDGPGHADPSTGQGGPGRIDTLAPRERPSRVVRVGWVDSPWLHLAAFGFLVSAFGAVLFVGWRGRRRLSGTASRRDGGRADGVAAIAGLLVVPGTIGYLGYLAATASQAPGPVLLGRPVAWLVLQLLAVTVIVATATVLVLARARGRTLGVGTLSAATAVFLPWAAYWGLLAP